MNEGSLLELELEQCKTKALKNIQLLLGEGKVDEAEKLITEFELILAKMPGEKPEGFLEIKQQLLEAKKGNKLGCVSNADIIEWEIAEDNTNNIEFGDVFKKRKHYNSLILGKNRCKVSIYILAYNNLEKYTKPCVESVLKHTNNIGFELVLIDNGSSDDTLEYFQQVPYEPKKIVHINENRGSVLGGILGVNHMQGEYLVCLPNDVIVTPYWMDNLLKCAESDNRIGLITTMSDSISNLQSVSMDFTNLEELEEKAAKYNVSDPRKWEERLRLVTPIIFLKRECFDIVGKMDCGFVHNFGDDDLTFRVRRAGYKAILCKDVFIHHAGGMNISQKQVEDLKRGRQDFQNKYWGIDAWDDAGNYELSLLSLLDFQCTKQDKAVNVLGIEVRCGTPILQIKNMLKEKGISDVVLSALVEDGKYWLDLKTICDGSVVVGNPLEVKRCFTGNQYKYILVGKELNLFDEPLWLLEQLLECLAEKGTLLLKIANQESIVEYAKILGIVVNCEMKKKNTIDIDALKSYFESKNDSYKFLIDVAESFTLDEETERKVRNSIQIFNQTNIEIVMQNLMVKEYSVSITKIQ